MYDIILVFSTAFLLTFFAIPSIISIARKKELFDEPGERRSHQVNTPSLGGIGIFAGTIFSIILWTPFRYFGDLQYILCAFIIVLLIGAKDDIDPLSPRIKLVGQFFAAAILVFFSKIRITSFYGIFGITDIPFGVSVVVTLLTIVLIINAFNLIDGINGLSGSIGVLIAVTFGAWFFLVDRVELASVSFALAGSVVAFLYYNVTPAKIFMGDTGSLLLGLVASILAISFIEYNQVLVNSPYAFEAPVAVAIGILILPIYDTLRVLLMRILKGKAPFHPDRNHIHHLLLDTGLSHMQSTSILIVVNLSFIAFVFYFQSLGTIKLIVSLIILATLLIAILYYVLHARGSRRSIQNSY
jgi:UDP-N-acetylmuramyl pentapeptide phosphotransferase/UDP-N-acetylglucosamine-1-phosphate transferase